MFTPTLRLSKPGNGEQRKIRAEVGNVKIRSATNHRPTEVRDEKNKMMQAAMFAATTLTACGRT